jgi:anti-sigma factor RsiW
MSCKELVELVTEYLEGTLSAMDRARFEAHLAGCDDCDVYLQQMRQTISLVGELQRPSPWRRDELWPLPNLETELLLFDLLPRPTPPDN